MKPSLFFRSLWAFVSTGMNGVHKTFHFESESSAIASDCSRLPRFALQGGALYAFLLLCGCGTQTKQEKVAVVPEPAVGLLNSVELKINGNGNSNDMTYEIKASEVADIEMAFRAEDEKIETSAGLVKIYRISDGNRSLRDSGSFQEPEDRDGHRMIRVLLNSQKRLNPGEYSVEVYFATQADQKVPAASARLRVVE